RKCCIILPKLPGGRAESPDHCNGQHGGYRRPCYGTDMNTQTGQQPTSDQGSDNANANIRHQAKAKTSNDQTSHPATSPTSRMIRRLSPDIVASSVVVCCFLGKGSFPHRPELIREV